MKKFVLMLLVMVCLSGTAIAGDKFSVDAGVDYTSRYIWRGMDLIGDDNGAVQPWMDGGFAITDKLAVHGLFWADYRTVDGDYAHGKDNTWDEFDYVLYGTYDLNDTLSFELGYIYYYLPANAWNFGQFTDQEFYGGISAALNDYLSSSFYVYYNFDNDSHDGIYAKLAFDGAKSLTETAELFGSIGIGYMDYDSGVNGFADLPLSVGVSVDLGHGIAMYVSANYSVTLEALRNEEGPDDDKLNDENEAWVMTGLSYSM